jgi:hypothetical protein
VCCLGPTRRSKAQACRWGGRRWQLPQSTLAPAPNFYSLLGQQTPLLSRTQQASLLLLCIGSPDGSMPVVGIHSVYPKPLPQLQYLHPLPKYMHIHCLIVPEPHNSRSICHFPKLISASSLECPSHPHCLSGKLLFGLHGPSSHTHPLQFL